MASGILLLWKENASITSENIGPYLWIIRWEKREVCVCGGYSQIILAVRNALEWQQKPTSAMVASVQEMPRYQGTIAGKVLSHVIIDPGSKAITA